MKRLCAVAMFDNQLVPTAERHRPGRCDALGAERFSTAAARSLSVRAIIHQSHTHTHGLIRL